MPRIQGSSNNGSYLYVDYVINASNVAGNYTDVSWTVGVHWGSYYFRIDNAQIVMGTNASGASVSGDTGTGVYNSGWPIPGAGTNRDHPFASGTTRVHHNTNGFGNITFNGTAFWDTPVNFTSAVTQAVGINQILRKSNPPSTPVISSIQATSVFVTFSDGSGGAPIDSREIRYGLLSNGSDGTIISSDGSTTISGLTTGLKYYFWARTHNVAGFSDWSGRAEATTLRVPDPPSQPVITEIEQTSVRIAFNAGANNGGTGIIGHQVRYGLNSDGSGATISPGSPPRTISGLLPGRRYYFWARSENSVGFSSWSPSTQAQLIAGAIVRQGTLLRKAVPYVKVAGVYRRAHPWIKVDGVWKRTIT